MYGLLLRCDGFNYKKLDLVFERKGFFQDDTKWKWIRRSGQSLTTKLKRRGSLEERAIGDHIPILLSLSHMQAIPGFNLSDALAVVN
jgi:hypothetical protein